MKYRVLGALALLVAALAPASEVRAEEWWQKVMNDMKAQNAPAARRTTAAAPQRTASARAAASVDDGTRPQRKTEARPKPAIARQSVASTGGGETGIASYYWQPQALASGGRFNPDAYTAAHKTLPFWTRVRVTRLDNGNSVDVVINDRGPYVGGRVIDLSRRAAQSIGMTGQGLARVKVTVLGRG